MTERERALRDAIRAIENEADELSLAETVDSWRAVREGMRRAAAAVKGLMQ